MPTAAQSSSAVNGLCSVARHPNDCATFKDWLRPMHPPPDIITTGRLGVVILSSRIASKPSMVGMYTSIKTRSGI